MHAALFARPNVASLRAPHTGTRTDPMLAGMQALPLLLDLAMDGRLDARSFARVWRRRRSHAPYLRALLRACEARGRPALAARVCRWGLHTVDRPLFARTLARLGLPEDAPGPVTAARPAP
jgi:hypothetical protein